MKESVLIAGGTGLIGNRFIELLDQSKYDIHILSRRLVSESDAKIFNWNFDAMTIDEDAVKVDYIINLNGAGIADKKWTRKRKNLLIESRIKSANLIKLALENTGHRPKAYISASAVGFYGNRNDEELIETSPGGSGFMADCCQAWEDSATELTPFVDRLVIDRIGIVLSSKGGALEKILMTKQIGVYNYFGNGAQYYSWIHIDDVCKLLFNQMVDDSYFGVYNAVSPRPLTNKKFTVEIKEALNGNLVLPVPVLGLRIMLGEMANVVLNSNRVLPKRLTDRSFDFKFEDLGEAVTDLINNNK